jgi:DNA-binding NarL/FixJ family response regulator
MPYTDLTSYPSQRALGSVRLITENHLLGSALTTALTSLSWQVQLNRETAWRWAGRQPNPGEHIVLVADGAGVLPDRPAQPVPAGAACVAVGSRTALAALIHALAEGATAVDADQPFVELVQRVHQLLLNPLSPRQKAELARRLELRRAEAGRFSTLTRRERQVLIWLAHGLSATEIAGREHLSLPTVRSHIQSLLAKSSSSSQLAAVALAHRACDHPEMVVALRELHQF